MVGRGLKILGAISIGRNYLPFLIKIISVKVSQIESAFNEIFLNDRKHINKPISCYDNPDKPIPI